MSDSPMRPAAATVFTLSSAATTNATSVVGNQTSVFALSASNGGAGSAYVKLYNKATAPTVGTDVPVLTIPVGASAAVALEFGTLGHLFPLGVGLAITGAFADSDTTAVAAAQVKVILSHRQSF